MTVSNAFALTLSLTAAFGLGVWTGPRITAAPEREPAPVVRLAPEPAAAPAAPAPAAKAVIKKPAVASVDLSDPKLHRQLKPVLYKDTDMAKAAEGFKSAEQFAMVAYASRQTGVRFAVLKYRVLNEGKTLTSAIRESLPTTNAAREVERARASARSTLQSIGG